MSMISNGRSCLTCFYNKNFKLSGVSLKCKDCFNYSNYSPMLAAPLKDTKRNSVSIDVEVPNKFIEKMKKDILDGKVCIKVEDTWINLKDNTEFAKKIKVYDGEKWVTVFPEKEIVYIDYGEALRKVEAGCKIARKGWNGKNIFIIYQGGSKTHKLENGEVVKLNPYFLIKNVDETYSTWVPSVGDTLAKDWYVVE